MVEPTGVQIVAERVATGAVAMAAERARQGAVARYAWTIGDKFRKIRRVHHLTQDQFAAAIGVNSKSLAAWENDAWQPRGMVAIAKRIELAFGVPAAWTLGLDEAVDATKPLAEDEGLAVRRQGLEPRTRYVDATASEDGIARILPADSNPDAADSRFEADADVIQLPTWRNQPGVIREAVAR